MFTKTIACLQTIAGVDGEIGQGSVFSVTDEQAEVYADGVRFEVVDEELARGPELPTWFAGGAASVASEDAGGDADDSQKAQLVDEPEDLAEAYAQMRDALPEDVRDLLDAMFAEIGPQLADESNEDYHARVDAYADEHGWEFDDLGFPIPPAPVVGPAVVADDPATPAVTVADAPEAEAEDTGPKKRTRTRS